jgi:phosphoserine phosphatase
MQSIAVTFVRRTLPALLIAAGICCLGSAAAQTPDPLPSWNDGPVKKSITDFVPRVTTPGGADFVPRDQRIATFDNDGTLWAEQPMYFQIMFAMDRVKALAPRHPDWRKKQPFKSVLDDDRKALAALGEKGFLQIMAATHTGMTSEEFTQIATEWIATARHPRFNRPYTDLVYQPMLELLAYLRENGFKTFIVSGGGIEFMRPWTEKAYGIPPEQVVGSSAVTKFQLRGDGTPVLLRDGKLEFVDDRSASTASSAAVPCSPSAIPTVTSRCWNGPRRGVARASWGSSTTPMPCANGPMTATRRWDGSTRPGMRRSAAAGPSST